MANEAPKNRNGLFRRKGDARGSVSPNESVDKSSSDGKRPSMDSSFASAERIYNKPVFDGIFNRIKAFDTIMLAHPLMPWRPTGKGVDQA